MKKLYLLSLFAAATLSFQTAKAQTTLTQAVDFTVTDVNGVVYNLFDILNGGQHVCIDFFFDTCPPCQATSPYFKQTYTNFGCNSEDIFFIAIDVGDTDAEVIAYENSILGGAPGYPSVSGLGGGGNAVCSTYGISAYPTYILIRPDQAIIEQDMWPIGNAGDFATFFAANGLNPIPCTVGINEQDQPISVSVYPNPATDFLTVNSKDQVQDFRVYNLLGAEVLTGRFSNMKNASNQVDISTLPSGVYVLELVSETGSGRVKFTKQ